VFARGHAELVSDLLDAVVGLGELDPHTFTHVVDESGRSR
jgi:hypothetical protein